MIVPRRRQVPDGQLGDGPFAGGKQLLCTRSPARKPASTNKTLPTISVTSVLNSTLKLRAKSEANFISKSGLPVNPLLSDDCLTGDFVDNFPDVIPAIVCCGPVAIFHNGTSLKWFQALDLGKMITREKGEQVLGSVNSTGYILAYEMGYGKTPTSIGLICANPAAREQLGSPATLVLCPNKGVMMHWRSEIEKFAPKLTVNYYDSISAPFDPNADVILATYHQLRNQHRAILRDPANKLRNPLFNYKFHRVIADEAHIFRNPETKGAEACWALSKYHGLCLSGTPAQNSPLDFYSLFRFLNVTYRGINKLDTFQQLIYHKRQRGPIMEPNARTLHDILDEFCILRNKIQANGTPLVNLPRKKDKTLMIHLTSKERMVYDYVRFEKTFKSQFAKLMRLRQACDHPVLLLGALNEDDTDEAAEQEMRIKLDSGVPFSSTPVISNSKNLPHQLATSDKLFSCSYSSSKLRAMMSIINTRNVGEKTLIFTHFTSMIPSIVKALDKSKINFTEYTGDMTTMQRERALQEIANDADCTVLIASITAGGVGLNITSCNNVIIMEPWWNPFVEEQAICRVHRIGQTRPVNIYRLVVSDTIEEAIVKTQKLKEHILGQVFKYHDVPSAQVLKDWIE